MKATLQSNKLPWKRINDYLLKTGTQRDPRQLIITSVEKMSSLISFDQARIYFIDVNGRVSDFVVLGAKNDWIEAYLEYYSKLENGKYSISRKVESDDQSLQNLNVRIRDWEHQTLNDEFLKDYIKPQGIQCSAGLMFHSADNHTKCIFTLDRINRTGFSKEEIRIMEIVQPHVDNFHKNLYVMLSKANIKTLSDIDGSLSKREREIAELICSGMSPAQISENLFICISTIYRHIANIHLKLNVSTRQELILKLIKMGVSPNI